MTREEYEEQRWLLVTALTEFDANNPPPPAGFDVVSAVANVSNPSEPGIDLVWSESLDAADYRIEYFDTSMNLISSETTGGLTEKTNAGSGRFAEHDGYVSVMAISDGGERAWDAGSLRFPS